MPFDPSAFSDLGPAAVVSVIALALVWHMVSRLPVTIARNTDLLTERMDIMTQQIKANTAVTISHSQILVAHDLTVRGINDAVSGDGAAALKIYEDIQRNLEEVKRQIFAS